MAIAGVSDKPSRRLHHLPVQEPECRQWPPCSRQFGASDGPNMVAGHRLASSSQEIRVSPDLLLTPGLVRQRRDMVGENLGHPRGAAHGGDDRPKRIVARGVQADGFNHDGRLARIDTEIKRLG